MYLSTLRLWNFRKYCAMADGKPGLEIHFQEGVNVLIGENDSGKTASGVDRAYSGDESQISSEL